MQRFRYALSPSRLPIAIFATGLKPRPQPAHQPERDFRTDERKIREDAAAPRAAFGMPCSAAGYATAAFGKWHVGDSEGRWPMTLYELGEWIESPQAILGSHAILAKRAQVD